MNTITNRILTLLILLVSWGVVEAQIQLDVRVKLWDNVGRSQSEIQNIVNAAVSTYYDQNGPTNATANIIESVQLNGDEFALSGTSMVATWANAWAYETNVVGNDVTHAITIFFFGSGTFNDLEGYAPVGNLWLNNVNVIMVEEQATDSAVRRTVGHEIGHCKGALHSCSGNCSSCGNELMASEACGDEWDIGSIDQIQQHCGQYFDAQNIQSTFPSLDTLCWLSPPENGNVEWQIEYSADGSNWNIIETMPIGVNTLHHFVTNQTGFYRPVSMNWDNSYTIGDEVYFDFALLPVELEWAEVDCDSVRFELATQSGNDGIEVQMASDGINFDSIGWVPGAGTTQEPMVYSHPLPDFNGIRYIRLWQFDFDGGNEQIGDIMTVNCILSGVNEPVRLFKVMGNPVRYNINLQVIPPEPLNLVLTTITGQQVGTWQVNDQNITIDISHLPAGQYILNAVNQSREYHSEQLIKL